MSAPTSHASDQDEQDLAAAIRLADQDLALLHSLSARHTSDLPGDTMAAFSRATTDLEMLRNELRLIGHHLRAA